MPYARLEDRAVVTVVGEAAHDFLQNLITADLDRLPADAMQPAALLTPQGKIFYDFLVGPIAGGFRLDCAAGLRDALIKRLVLYRLRAKAAIEASPEPVFAIWDADAAHAGAFADLRFPHGGVHRLYGEAPAGMAEGSLAAFRALRIGAGAAEAETDFATSEFFPHDLLLDQNGGVSFRKGCFVGQEVVSRMQHRGTARRRLVLLSGDGALTPGAGVELGGRSIGSVLAASGPSGFGVLRVDKLGPGLTRGESLAAEGVALSASLPAWADIALPGAEATDADGSAA